MNSEKAINMAFRNPDFNRSEMKKIIGGQNLNNLERILATLKRYKKEIGKPSQEIKDMAIKAMLDESSMNKFLQNMPIRIPFLVRNRIDARLNNLRKMS